MRGPSWLRNSMHRPTWSRAARRHLPGAARRFRGRRRGVSDVIATILILALTVTLFASIFAFVTSFPAPPAQNTSQFQASLGYNGSMIKNLTIRHEAGPILPTSDKVILESGNTVTNWQFSTASGIPVAWGLSPPNGTSGWSLGQSWITTFSKQIKAPDNITVYIVSSSQLLFTVVLPGLSLAIPPAIVGSGTVPSTPSEGAAFQIYASLAGNVTGATVTVALGGITGLSGTPAMVKSGGLWVYNVSAGRTTSNGTFYAFINVTNGGGQSASTTVLVDILGSGGGSGSSSLSVAVGMGIQPPTLPKNQTYFWAAVTYPGSASNLSVNVTFWVNETASPIKTAFSYKFYAAVTKISGPSTVTVFSSPQPTFPGSGQAWFLNASVRITALATVSGSRFTTESANGTTSFSTANLVQGIVYTTTSSSGSTGSITTSFSHTCTSSNCPYLFVTVWNNFTTALGGPSNLSVNGTVTEVSGPHTYGSGTYTIATTKVNQGSTAAVNVIGSTNRLPTGGVAGTYVFKVLLTVSWSGTVIGYAWEQFKFTET